MKIQSTDIEKLEKQCFLISWCFFELNDECLLEPCTQGSTPHIFCLKHSRPCVEKERSEEADG